MSTHESDPDTPEARDAFAHLLGPPDDPDLTPPLPAALRARVLQTHAAATGAGRVRATPRRRWMSAGLGGLAAAASLAIGMACAWALVATPTPEQELVTALMMSDGGFVDAQ